jgi:hypothetical protein
MDFQFSAVMQMGRRHAHPLKFAKTNENGSYYYAGVSSGAVNVVEMIVIEHSQRSK